AFDHRGTFSLQCSGHCRVAGSALATIGLEFSAAVARLNLCAAYSDRDSFVGARVQETATAQFHHHWSLDWGFVLAYSQCDAAGAVRRSRRAVVDVGEERREQNDRDPPTGCRRSDRRFAERFSLAFHVSGYRRNAFDRVAADD